MFSSHRDKFQRFLLNELGSARSKVPKGLGNSSSSTSRPGDSPRDFRRITKWSAQRGFWSGCLTGGDLSTLYKTTRRVIGHTQVAVCVSGLRHTICHWTSHRCGFGFEHRYCILLSKPLLPQHDASFSSFWSWPLVLFGSFDLSLSNFEVCEIV